MLTDGPFFGGALADLERVREAVALPALRKDFMVDAYQVAEARAAGADAILIIVAALTDVEMAALLHAAERWHLDALVEAHDAAEVERALSVGARIVGINHRDLRTFQMDMTLAARLRERIPSDRVVVAESGIRTADDVERIAAKLSNSARNRRRCNGSDFDHLTFTYLLRYVEDPGAALGSLLARP